MKVLFASSEIHPYAKTGGLSDVSDALPFALSKHIDISRVMPFYSFMKKYDFEHYIDFSIKINKVSYEIEVLSEKIDKVVTYFIKTPLLSNTKNPYGEDDKDYIDNDLRFGLFSKAIVQLSSMLSVDILHLNDWHTALAPIFIKESNLKIKTIITIHNLAYQGVFSKKTLKTLGIDKKYFDIDGLEFYNKVNFLKGGIAFSDAVTTVSPTYAKEILTKEFGCGLDGFLIFHKAKITGILNGINYDVFNPLKDKSLYFTFDENNLESKHKNKIIFLKTTDLKDPRIPLFIMVTRLVEQKGIELFLKSIENLLDKKINLFVLGEGNSKISQKLEQLSSKYKNFKFFDGYDETLSHKTYAAADFLLMPSVFEPCGLNQFIAMRYGCIPIVHSVGGLKDSVFESKSKCGQGIVFKNQAKKEFLLAVDKALKIKKDKKNMESIVKSNMECDFSFKNSALEYLKIYKKIL